MPLAGSAVAVNLEGEGSMLTFSSEGALFCTSTNVLRMLTKWF
jgi:hypothetical protein